MVKRGESRLFSGVLKSSAKQKQARDLCGGRIARALSVACRTGRKVMDASARALPDVGGHNPFRISVFAVPAVRHVARRAETFRKRAEYDRLLRPGHLSPAL
ncbi:hypothetical protein GCM10010448_44420 [Streptomyces glomeratus]|uniref:Uncharacterized protein n=1 Tax=Streptomyces glomeratus TaxID=284452 RepID=A0ABP6LQP8_9ACTN